MGTAAIQMMSKAEKSVLVQQQQQQVQQQQQQQQPQPNQQTQSASSLQAARESFKQVDESVVTFLKTRMEFHRLLSQIEAKLLGKAEEIDSLETYIRTEPKIGNIGNKKRTLEEMNTHSSSSAPLSATAPAVSEVSQPSTL
jgi:hypothetical protein